MLSLPKPSSYPISSFIYGLAVGQISVIIVMLVFIRFLYSQAFHKTNETISHILDSSGRQSCYLTRPQPAIPFWKDILRRRFAFFRVSKLVHGIGRASHSLPQRRCPAGRQLAAQDIKGFEQRQHSQLYWQNQCHRTQYWKWLSSI